jgi:hypothetical protein
MKIIELEKSEIMIISELLTKKRSQEKGIAECIFDQKELRELRLTVKTIDDILEKLKC